MVKAMRVRSPAKVNLQLRVGPLQPDGFHPLVSWMVTVGLFDTLDFSPASSSDGVGSTVLTCSDPTLPTDGRNLVVKAADMLRTRTGVTAGVRIHLTKTIPAGGGLGGGSGNAATTLVALNDLWQTNLSTTELAEMAAKLGSDVAFFLATPSAACTGRGEIVMPVEAPNGVWAVLILPDLAMPTPAVYRQLDQMRATSSDRGGTGDWGNEWDAPIDWAAWRALSVEKLLTRLENDLEAPAFALKPELGVLRERIEQNIGRPVRMSGSGSTLFTLFDDQEVAEMGAKMIRDKFSVPSINVPLAARV